MEAREILKADLLDILFDQRNKQYGAYQLRRTYTKRLGLALGATILAGMAAALLIRPVAAEGDDQLIAVREVVLQNIAEMEVPPPPPPPPPKEEAPAPEKATAKAAAPQAAAPRVKTTKYTPPVIVDDKEVSRSEVPPVSEITKVDVVSVEGIRADDMALSVPKVADAPIGSGKEPGVVIPPAEEDENKIFEKVEIEARVPAAQWRRHLERHLVRYIEEAAYEGMPPGTYTVRVRFLVEKDGSIGRVQALNKPGYGLASGAEEVVRSGPRWMAAEQNGRKVRSYHTQPITFVIMES